MKKRFISLFGLLLCFGFIQTHPAHAEGLSDRLKGRILLQVESKGEAWYVNPGDAKRYYMANGLEAFTIMRDLGVGITNKDLDKVKSDKNFAKKHHGKIFLQVESKGEAFYIDVNGDAYYLKNGEEAYLIMSKLGLGIKTSDLALISLSEKDKKTKTDVSGLKIVVKDFGMPDVHYLKPTIKEFQLKNESEKWVSIWKSEEGVAVNLTPDGAETTLDIVAVPAGIYKATRLYVSTMEVGVDVNRDGDIEDKNVQTIITEEEFSKLPQKEKPSAPSKPSGGGDKPAKMSASIDSGSNQSPGTKDDKPSKPSEPSAPSAPYTIKDGYVYLPEFQDEEHVDTINNFIEPQMSSQFDYDGSGGTIIYDFTLHPLLPKGQHISIDVKVSS